MTSDRAAPRISDDSGNINRHGHQLTVPVSGAATAYSTIGYTTGLISSSSAEDRAARRSKPIFCDLRDTTDDLLVEAKGTVTRNAIRMAVGQLADYERFVEPTPRLAVLVTWLSRAGTARRLGAEWARLGSNQRPLACEASALPLSYAPEARNLPTACIRRPSSDDEWR